MREHVVITGTGRAGTTFLVQLFTALGIDTGFSMEQVKRGYGIYPNANAGMERDVRRPDAPYVCKTPLFCDYAKEVMDNKEIKLTHIVIPMRLLEAAAYSRLKVLDH